MNRISPIATKETGGTQARISDREFKTIASLVSESCGINLTTEKLELVNSRLLKRLRANELKDFGQYIDFVTSDAGKGEFSDMISALTTNVTSFHREPHHFDHFIEKCLPLLNKRLAAGESVRIWSAGCSNGSEPHNLAGIILDKIPEAPNRDVRILATDIDIKSIERARAGIYSKDFVQKLPESNKSKWFDRDGENYRIKPKIQKLVQFNILNLMDEWPIKKKFDVIFCRNVMIYFSMETQSKLLMRFVDSMKSHSFLYIGHSERIEGPAAKSLRPVGMTIYERI